MEIEEYLIHVKLYVQYKLNLFLHLYIHKKTKCRKTAQIQIVNIL